MGLSWISDDSLRGLFKSFNRFMVLLWRLGLAKWGNANKYAGYVMVLKHTGRNTGQVHHTPLNYAHIEGDIYCTAAFGAQADWYRNLMANPRAEVWLPDGRWSGIAEDVTKAQGAAQLLREVLIASGFAGPLFGFNPRLMTEGDYHDMLESYRLVRIRPTGALTGPGGPGDLAWVWPLSTFLLLGLVLRGVGRKRDEEEMCRRRTR
jgi:deazaflavin-dependent oxidoreductase (nitroreductase family)